MATDNHAVVVAEEYCESLEMHEEHLCQLLQRVSAGEIISMLDLPGYVCKNCSRSANSAEYLCRPQSLDEVP